jgi:hypothetical protein
VGGRILLVDKLPEPWGMAYPIPKPPMKGDAIAEILVLTEVFPEAVKAIIHRSSNDDSSLTTWSGEQITTEITQECNP